MFHTRININGTNYPLAVNIVGTNAPTSSTAGEVGMFYMSTTSKLVYKCTAVSGNTYTWVPLIPQDVSVNAAANLVVRRDTYGQVVLPEQQESEIENEVDIAVSGRAVRRYVANVIGNIETALDGIIATQESLIGGDT